MNLGTLDLSTLPPAVVLCVVVLVLVCHVLPDAISLSPSLRSSHRSSRSGQRPTDPSSTGNRTPLSEE